MCENTNVNGDVANSAAVIYRVDGMTVIREPCALTQRGAVGPPLFWYHRLFLWGLLEQNQLGKKLENLDKQRYIDYSIFPRKLILFK